MAPTVYQASVLANILASNISMAITTSQAAVLSGGRPDRRYLFGVFSATFATAKALGLPWSDILADSLGNLDAMKALIHGTPELNSKPLVQLVTEIEAVLLDTP